MRGSVIATTENGDLSIFLFDEEDEVRKNI